jgi:ribonucleoside-diphosphate reductase alpha subunit
MDSSGLNVDNDKLSELISRHGLYEAARIVGFDISHYDNLLAAGRMAITHLRSSAPKTLLEFSQLMSDRLSGEVRQFIAVHHVELQHAIDNTASYEYDWFSANTLIKTYSSRPSLMHDYCETPEYLWMRVAIALYHDTGVEAVLSAYRDMARGYYTPASPTLFNAGFRHGQMASCFLFSIRDSMRSILEGITIAGAVSKNSGGLGIDISLIRHSEIDGMYMSDGILPLVQLYNDTVRYVNQKGRRKGAATLYLRPHHIDIEDFIDISKKVGDRYARAHDVHTCIWTGWLFWDRVISDGSWSLFCPKKTPQLNDVYGVEFAKLYEQLENDPSIPKRTLRARDLYKRIVSTQRETGLPYLMNGDSCNIKSNHRHLGYIRQSNLCLEIVEHTGKNKIAACNLHSIVLKEFVKSRLTGEGFTDAFDFPLLARIVRTCVLNLNAMIDKNWWPLDKKQGAGKIHISAQNDRPLGIGVCGFHDVLCLLDIHFTHPATYTLNKLIFGCMYFNALIESLQLAIIHGPYPTYVGSPISQGKLQFDLWREEFELLGPNAVRTREDDEPIDPTSWGQTAVVLSNGETVHPSWSSLKELIVKHGVRNSLLLSVQPTASTAQIRRSSENVEAYQSNFYVRNVLSSSYVVLNPYLVSDLEEIGCWNDSVVELLKANNGSCRGLSTLYRGQYSERLAYLEVKYRTVWEISQKVFLKLAADRGRYICQSQSTNIFLTDCTDEKLQAIHIYSNMLGLKTLMYYLRQGSGEVINYSSCTDKTCCT